MPSFMAKWSAQYPGCSGHLHQSLTDGSKNVFHDARGPQRHVQGLRKLSRRTVNALLGMAPMFWPTVNSYKRLVDGFWAPVKPTWGVDNRTASFRVIPGGPSPRAWKRAARVRT
jgi:glutamine synthetase